MNVRFADRAVRCRVTRTELERLLSGRAVELELALPRERLFRVNVRPAALQGWQLDSDPTGIWLAIPRAELASLSEALPSKEGIEQHFEVANGERLLVSFEVDIRERS